MLPFSMLPERIARFRVDRLLGAGGMGEVYLAEDSTLHRKVALKLLPARFTQDAERVRRFQREARAASALNHPNIITIYDIGEHESTHYIATEYIEGQTLRDRIVAGPLSIAEVLDVAIGVANALVAAHAAGIIHRDIKPENIMLRPDGYVKVLDFGLAKLTEDIGSTRDSASGAVMGTLLYISPEQARGRQPDARSDLYSLGAVIYEMITGSPPITSENLLDLAVAIASEKPIRPSTVVPNVPPELDRIILKALEKNRDLRYQAARELLSDLKVLRRQLERDDDLLSDPHRRLSQPFTSTARLSLPLQATTSRDLVTVGRLQISKITVALTLAVVAFVGALAWLIVTRVIYTKKPLDSIAVLPFLNASGDPNSEYLSDGISESIIDSLSGLPHLQVVARSTTFRYKGKNVDPLTVGRELHVRGVVTGRLIARGDTLVIRAALTDVDKGTQVWGQQYDRRIADVLAVQHDIAGEISNQLRMHVSGDEKKIIAKRAGGNPEAFQLYLKGRYYREKFTEESIRKSIACYQQAIELDPAYALPYAGLADSYYALSNIYMPPREAMPRAREAAQQALRLDDTLPQAHSSLALVLVWYDWDFANGEREFRRAISLNPTDSDAHRAFGDYLTARGQFDLAFSEKKKAEDLDPLSLQASWDVGRALYYAGRYAEAEQQAKKTLELDDRFPYTYFLLSEIALHRGRTADALALCKKAVDLGNASPVIVGFWGYVNAIAGNRAEAEKTIAELKSRGGKYLLPLLLARIYGGLGQNDEAMRQLEQLYQDRSESIVWLKVDSTLEPLRKDPRFLALVRRVGI